MPSPISDRLNCTTAECRADEWNPRGAGSPPTQIVDNGRKKDREDAAIKEDGANVFVLMEARRWGQWR